MYSRGPPARPQQLQPDQTRARMKSTGSTAQPEAFTSDVDDLDSGSASSGVKSTGGCSPRRESGEAAEEEAAGGGGSLVGTTRRRRRRRKSSGGCGRGGGDARLSGINKQRGKGQDAQREHGLHGAPHAHSHRAGRQKAVQDRDAAPGLQLHLPPGRAAAGGGLPGRTALRPLPEHPARAHRAQRALPAAHLHVLPQQSEETAQRRRETVSCCV
uniref:Uncharacterized protein n=1 Tax=Monopterus albus TaxID=43700 RepID=A0A3Q3QCV5_MONAL